MIEGICLSYSDLEDSKGQHDKLNMTAISLLINYIFLSEIRNSAQSFGVRAKISEIAKRQHNKAFLKGSLKNFEQV